MDPNSCFNDLSDSLDSLISLNSMKCWHHWGKTPICHVNILNRWANQGKWCRRPCVYVGYRQWMDYDSLSKNLPKKTMTLWKLCCKRCFEIIICQIHSCHTWNSKNRQLRGMTEQYFERPEFVTINSGIFTISEWSVLFHVICGSWNEFMDLIDPSDINVKLYTLLNHWKLLHPDFFVFVSPL